MRLNTYMDDERSFGFFPTKEEEEDFDAYVLEFARTHVLIVDGIVTPTLDKLNVRQGSA